MEPILNLTAGVYEAIIAAFVVIGLWQAVALRRKWQQAEKLKATTKTVIIEATKALITSAMHGSLQVARARAETRKITEAADAAIDRAGEVIRNLTEQVETLREENQESRIDDLETTVAELVAEHNGRVTDDDEARERPSSPFDFGDIESRIAGRFPFESPGPFAGAGGNPLDALFASLGRGGLSPTGRTLRGEPTVRAFVRTPGGGLRPVSGPEDFRGILDGLASGGTFNRSTPNDLRQPSLPDILSLLASLPTRRPAPPANENVKADLGSFLHDEHGPAAPGDDPYAKLAASVGPQPSTVETEACDTQRGNSYEATHTAAGDRCAVGDPAAIAASPPVAGAAVESPANDPGPRVPRYARDLDRPYGRQGDPTGFPGLSDEPQYQSPRAG